MKKKHFLILYTLSLISLSSCSGGRDGIFGGYTGSTDEWSSYGDGGSDTGYTFDESDFSGGYDTGDLEHGGSENDNQIPSGQLTAKALFDNETENYNYFCSLLKKDDQTNGAFSSYYNKFKLDYRRVAVTVKNTPYANVDLLDGENNILFSTVSDANGQCYLFSNKESSKVRVTVGTESKTYDAADNLEITDFSSTIEHNKIQLLFNIDTTGSMGDEINYLKAEVKNVCANIAEKTSADVELGFIVYRDYSDDYIVKTLDFTSSIDDAMNFLNTQYASGGGDFEEAVQNAYARACQFTWKNDATKVIIHAADAPSHDNDVNEWFGYVKQLNNQGIRILTVASSGIDKKTEYFFRMQSLYTNGCYSFLTDDSGIGGSHLEATTANDLTIELLNDLLIRVIKGFHTGTFDEPVYYLTSKYPFVLKFNNELPLTNAAQGLIVKQYLLYMGKDIETNKAAVKYFYYANDIKYVYMEDDFSDVTENTTVEKVGGYSFSYPDASRKILVIKDSSFISMTEAYNSGYIFSEDVAEIYAKATPFQTPVE